MHIDTGYKFLKMIEFENGLLKTGWNGNCCARLKTQGLINAIKKHKFDAAFGGARREKEKFRAKERFLFQG